MGSNKEKKVIITGASGMIGSRVLQHCLDDERIKEVVSLVRKATTNHHPNLTEVVISDFGALDSSVAFWQNIDVAYYCIGVYTGSVPRDLFRAITVDYPVHFAQVLKSHNPNAQFVLLSGQGADRTEKSKMMFAKDKGIVENLLSKMQFKQFFTLRPSYIYPVDKREEPSFSYRIMRRLYPVIRMLGPKYSIASHVLADVMFDIGLTGGKQEIMENVDLLNHFKKTKS
jgi:uncharacterized protein YbjT (DUF2867 family)